MRLLSAAGVVQLARGGRASLPRIAQGVVRTDGGGSCPAQRVGELGVLFGHAFDERAVELIARGLCQKVDGVLRRHRGTLGEDALVHLVVTGMLGKRGADLRVEMCIRDRASVWPARNAHMYSSVLMAPLGSISS